MSENQKYVIAFPADYKPCLSDLPEYKIWAAIKSRCTNFKADFKKRYVWRGIKMCDRWSTGQEGKTGFECFMEDMGNRPSRKHSVDRINNDGHYEPGNCRWATNKEQANNRSNNHKLQYRGEAMSMLMLAEKTGISYFVLRNRINRGWPVEDAVHQPLGTALFKPRTARGTSLPQSRLQEWEVRKIREIYPEGHHTMHEIALMFGISAGSVCHIVNRQTWKHVK